MHAQISKAQKKTVKFSVFFALLGSAQKLLVDYWWNWHQVAEFKILVPLLGFLLLSSSNLGSISPTYLHTAFTPVAPKSVRNQSSCQYLFTLWDILAQKLLVERWWNWHLNMQYEVTNMNRDIQRDTYRHKDKHINT